MLVLSAASQRGVKGKPMRAQGASAEANPVFVNEQLPWFEALDDLPRFATTGRDGASPIRIGPSISRSG
jgi:hypothetical protein